MEYGDQCTVFVDHACRNNGQERACGAFRLFFGDDDNRNVVQVPLQFGKQSNNAAALHGVIRALQIVYTTPPSGAKRVVVQTCSKYTVGHRSSQYCWSSCFLFIFILVCSGQADGVCRLPEWKTNGWRKSDGRPVQNLVLWKMVEMFLHPRVKVTHVCKTTPVAGNAAVQRRHLRNTLKDYRPPTLATTVPCPLLPHSMDVSVTTRLYKRRGCHWHC